MPRRESAAGATFVYFAGVRELSAGASAPHELYFPVRDKINGGHHDPRQQNINALIGKRDVYSAFGVAGGSSRLSAAGPGSSQMRLSSETKSMDFFVEGRGRSSAFLRPLPSFSTVEGMSRRLLAAVRPFSSICLCRTFSTALLQARRGIPLPMFRLVVGEAE